MQRRPANNEGRSLEKVGIQLPQGMKDELKAKCAAQRKTIREVMERLVAKYLAGEIDLDD